MIPTLTPAPPLQVAVVGCGDVSTWYADNLAEFSHLRVAACCDRNPALARELAQRVGARALDWEEVLADPRIDLVVNLTPPAHHFSICAEALQAGKHVYGEKPIVIDRPDLDRLKALADPAGLRIAAAPDVFLGGIQQTLRGVIDRGEIGPPVAVTGFMLNPGYELGKPGDTQFYYSRGAGPMRDMGIYYLTAWVHLFGPIRRVGCFHSQAWTERVIGTGVREGETLTVEVPTHYTANVEFHSGVLGTLGVSFDVPANTMPSMEIHGKTHSLTGFLPWSFEGEVKRASRFDGRWHPIEPTHPYHDRHAHHGLGIAEMADAIQRQRPHRISTDLLGHVLEVLEAMDIAAVEARVVDIQSICARPDPMPESFSPAGTP